MGAFFTNVQVRVGDASPRALLDAIGDAADEFDEVETQTEADRVVRVLPPDAGGWVTIYDQATESQDSASLEALGRLASSVGDGPAFSVTVHDSDVLLLQLFEGGETVDRFNSFPGYFEGRATQAQRNAAKGDPARWASALSIDGVALRGVWSGETLFAEQTLRQTCDLLGCSSERAALGFRYASEEMLPPGTLSVFLRARVRPAWETPAEGPPRFELHAQPASTTSLAVSDGFRLGVGCRNVGGVGRGLTLTVWGTAIERGLVEIKTFELLVGPVSADNPHRQITPTPGRSAEGPLLLHDDDTCLIPAGSAAPTGFAPGVDMRAMMEAMYASTVHVNLVGRVLATGVGQLGIGFVPHENPSGQVGVQTRLEVDGALRQPLRFAEHPMMGPSSQLLRPLAGDSRLNALVVLDVARAEAVEWVRTWLEEAPPTDAQTPATVSVYRLDPQKRPKTRRGALNMKLALSDMLRELTVQIDTPTWALAFGTGVLGHHEDRRIPTLRVSTTDVGRREDWQRRIDHAVDEGTVVQASLYRSDEAIGPTHSAYETACGIPQGVTTLRTWCDRWIRVPGDAALWLGPALAERLDEGSRAELRELAAVEPLGRGLRVALRDRAQMDAFEQALAALLPSQQDGQEASMRLHRPGGPQ